MKKAAKKKENETDFEWLGRVVADGFTHMTTIMNERFAEIDVRFGEMDERFDRLEKTVNETNTRIDVIVVPTLDSHVSRIKKLEQTAFA